MKTTLRRSTLACLALALAAAVATGAEREYDVSVKRLIEYTNRGVNDFRKAMRSDFKNAKITWGGVQYDVSSYMNDTADAGKKLQSRYNADYAAIPEAEDFLKRLKTADTFAKQNPGISGAKNEWDLLMQNVTKLAAAYGVDWNADATTWMFARTPDGPLKAAAATLETQSKSMRKAIDEAGKTAGLDKARRKVLEGQSETLINSAGDLRKAVDGSRSASSALQSVQSAMADLGPRLQADGLASAVSSAWGGVDASVQKLSGMLAGPSVP
jgi:hypothetical protein